MQESFDRFLASSVTARPILVAVSGGVDSMVMLDLFQRSSLRPDFLVAHCNFHLRGAESDGDELLVRQTAKALGRPFIKVDFDTSGFARSKGISIEMAARELRYNWFADLCAELGSEAVAVAHNANDQAETLLLNLLRGTGLKGLTGMRPCSTLYGREGLTLLRPLLGLTRDEIHEYASSGRLAWREDSSNADTSYKRNLLRREVFPLLAKLNPSFIKTLAADAERLSQVQALVDDCCSNALGKLLTESPDGETRADLSALASSKHRPYLLFRLLAPLGFSSSCMEDLEALLDKGAGWSGRSFLSEGWSAVTTSSELVISKRGGEQMCPDGISDLEDEGPRTGELVVEAEGEYSLKGTRFQVSLCDPALFAPSVGKGPALRVPQGTLVADSSKLSFPFIVRGWKAGDWMVPLGLGGRKKLSDLFVDLKMGLPEKKRALVVVGEGSRVVALLGKRVDESVKVTDSTGKALELRLL